MKKLALLVPLFAVLSASTAYASTTYNGYVCEMSYNPAVTTYGQHGFLMLELYSAANCSGTFFGSFVICSSGATNASCDPAFLHNENQILAVYQRVMSAMEHSFVTQIFGEPGGGINKAHTLSFFKQ
jgi:hypothetical protein